MPRRTAKTARTRNLRARKVLLLALVGMGLSGIPARAAGAASAPVVVSEDARAGGVALSVRLVERLSEADLRALTETTIKAQSPGKAVLSVAYYLPGENLAMQPWAEARVMPEIKLSIHGLRRDEVEALRASTAADPRPLLGAWLTSPPALPGKISIWRDKGKVFAEWQVRSGQTTVDEVREWRSNRGRRFEISGADGGYYLILGNGALELGDKTHVVAVAERLNIEKVQQAAKNPAAPVVHAPPKLAAPAREPVSAAAAEAAPKHTAKAPVKQPNRRPADAARKGRGGKGLTADANAPLSGSFFQN